VDFIKNALLFVVRLGVLAAIAAGLLLAFVVDIYEVPHNGMAPTLIYGDQVLVWRKAAVDFTNVVLCEHPARPEKLVLGRALAFAGHSISSDYHGTIHVDDDRSVTEPLGTLRFFDAPRDATPWMNDSLVRYGNTGDREHHVFLEEGHSFVLSPYRVEAGTYLLGDNRSEPSFDSREFGEVDPDKCKGQVFLRLAPAPSHNDDIDHGYLDYIR
jgi:signal peptidase I